MGTVGPGAIHLLNGLYDAKKSRVPVLAICGQVPREDIGSDFFQEVDNDAIFADLAVFRATVSSIDQLPRLIEQAVQVMASMGVSGPEGLRPHMLRRRVDHERVLSYAELFHHLEPGELLASAPRGNWERDWALADPDRFTP